MQTYRPLLLVCALAALFISGACSTSMQGATTVVPGETDPAIHTPIDTLAIESGNVELPPPSENETQYFKIQVLATGSFQAAENEKQKLLKYTMKNIFLIQEADLWKIQVGDYPTRESADKEKSMLASLGWTDAWLIQYRKTEGAATPRENDPPVEIFVREPEQPVKTAELAETELVYAVQVIATRNQKEAENLSRNLRLMDLSNIDVVNEENFWKVRVGRNRDYKQARELLMKIREMGFYDSWITSVKVPVANVEVITPIQQNMSLYVEILLTSDEIIARNEVRKIYLLTETQAFTERIAQDWSVRSGPFNTAAEADKFLTRVKELGYRSSRIIQK